MNVKRAVTTAAGVVGTLLLAAVVGLGHFAGHSTSGVVGAQVRTVATATASSNAAPIKATLDAQIYGDSANVPAGTTTSGDSTDDSSYTTTYDDSGSASDAIYGDSSSGSTIYGDGTSTIYGDGTTGSTSSSSSSTSSSTGTASQAIYGD